MKCYTSVIVKNYNLPSFIHYIKANMPIKVNLDIKDIQKISELKEKLFNPDQSPEEAKWITIYEASKKSEFYSRHIIGNFIKKNLIRTKEIDGAVRILQQDVELLINLKTMFEIFKQEGLIKETRHPDTGFEIYEYVLKSVDTKGLNEYNTQLVLALKQLDTSYIKNIVNALD